MTVSDARLAQIAERFAQFEARWMLERVQHDDRGGWAQTPSVAPAQAGAQMTARPDAVVASMRLAYLGPCLRRGDGEIRWTARAPSPSMGEGYAGLGPRLRALAGVGWGCFSGAAPGLHPYPTAPRRLQRQGFVSFPHRGGREGLR